MQTSGAVQPSVARSILEETMKDGTLSIEDEREIASALGALYAGETPTSRHLFCERVSRLGHYQLGRIRYGYN